MRHWKWLLLAVVVPNLGCADMVPRLIGPGNEREQQRWAARFDPYPNPEIGPEVVGGRPRDFQNPLPETEHSQAFIMSTRPKPPQARTPTPAVLPPPPYMPYR